MSTSRDLSPLFDDHRVLVCVGSGGVGKTTTAAAVAMAAAQRGKHTLCLTIDPARRLATSLGLATFPSEELSLPSDWLKEHGIDRGSLTVMMLDPQATFDALVQRFSSNGEEAERILGHRVYKHLTRNLAGTQAYMAMERVLGILDEAKYDLIILDTPPSARALDFFDAPERMAKIIDSPATRALVKALDRGGPLQWGILGVGIRVALRGVERITGAGLLGEFAELLGAMNGLFGGFEERAQRVGELLKSREFGYLLVTVPRARSLRDAKELLDAMSVRRLRIRAAIVNRYPSPCSASLKYSSEDPVLNRLSGAGKAVMKPLLLREQELRQRALSLIEDFRACMSPGVVWLTVPQFSDEVYTPGRLLRLSHHLVKPEKMGNDQVSSA